MSNLLYVFEATINNKTTLVNLIGNSPLSTDIYEEISKMLKSKGIENIKLISVTSISEDLEARYMEKALSYLENIEEEISMIPMNPESYDDVNKFIEFILFGIEIGVNLNLNETPNSKADTNKNYILLLLDNVYKEKDKIKIFNNKEEAMQIAINFNVEYKILEYV